MKTWKLIGVNEYKLYSDEQDLSQENNNTQFFLPKKEDEVKVKLIKANLSPVDYSFFEGSLESATPITPARSAVAYISENDNPEYQLGQRVFLSPYASVNSSGVPEIKSYHLDGYLSDFTNAPNNCIYTIPEGLSDNDALFIEDVAMCITAFNKLNIDKGEYVALYGASYLNCIFAQVAIYYQAIPVIIDTNDDDRLDIATSLGVYFNIDSEHEDIDRKTIEITSGKLFDHLIIDADNFPGADFCTHLVKANGSIGVYGYHQNHEDLPINVNTIMQKGITVYGINNGIKDIHSAINLLAIKCIRTDHLIEDETPFLNFTEVMKNVFAKSNPHKHIVTFN